jgi:hypothetical protein
MSTTTRLRGTAGYLRSAMKAERENAVRLIEHQTGRPVAETISLGAERTLTGPRLRAIRAALADTCGDALILAVGEAIRDLPGEAWNDLVEAGVTDTAANGVRPSQDPFLDAWNSIFGSHMASSAATFTQSNTVGGTTGFATDRPAPAPAQPSDLPVRVGRDDLPATASGVPHVSYAGKARSGQCFAQVSFASMTANGRTIRPICEMIAFGDDWVEELIAASEADREVIVSFEDDGDPGRKVVVRRAR